MKPRAAPPISGLPEIGAHSVHIGTVQAPDPDAAIKAAIRKYDIAPGHQHRVAAWPIVCGRIRPPARPSRHSDLGRKNRRFQPAARVSWGHHCGSLAPRRKTGAISLLHYPGHDPVVFTCVVCEICWRTGSRVMLAHEPAVSRKNRSVQQERESHVGVSCSPLSDSGAELIALYGLPGVKAGITVTPYILPNSVGRRCPRAMFRLHVAPCPPDRSRLSASRDAAGQSPRADVLRASGLCPLGDL